MTKQPQSVDVIAGIVAAIVGLAWIGAIWIALVFPAQASFGGGGTLSGDQVAIREHEWGFNQFAKGGPEICAVVGRNMTIMVRNDGKNLHGFQVVRDGGVFVAGLNKTDLLRPGEVRQITLGINRAESLFYICPVTGHRTKGMIGTFVVQPSC